jgi:ABC-2 type transport system ATP-binding protein
VAEETVILIKDLRKEYKISKREPGFWNALKALFARKYEIKKAVDGVSFEVKEGEIVGFIGPNGAGKSTTIKALTGILKPDSGEVRVLGLEPFKQRRTLAKKIGVVFGQRTQLWWDIPAIESFKLFQKIYEIPEQEFEKTYARVSGILELGDFVNQQVRKLSLGQRMRCEIAASILHNPRVLFLDEPTVGIDVVGKERIRRFIKEINKEFKTTIVLTSHDMFDVEKLAKRVIIIDEGRVVYDGGLDVLKKNYVKQKSVTVAFDKPIGEDRVKQASGGIASAVTRESDLSYSFDVPLGAENRLLQNLSKELVVLDIDVREPPVDDVIASIFSKREQERKERLQREQKEREQKEKELREKELREKEQKEREQKEKEPRERAQAESKTREEKQGKRTPLQLIKSLHLTKKSEPRLEKKEEKKEDKKEELKVEKREEKKEEKKEEKREEKK